MRSGRRLYSLLEPMPVSRNVPLAQFGTELSAKGVGSPRKAEVRPSRHQAIEPDEVRWRPEELAHRAETSLTAKQAPGRIRFWEIRRVDMGVDRIPLLFRTGGPDWLLRIPALQPVSAILTVRARILVYEEPPVVAEKAAHSRQECVFLRLTQMMQR